MSGSLLADPFDLNNVYPQTSFSGGTFANTEPHQENLKHISFPSTMMEPMKSKQSRNTQGRHGHQPPLVEHQHHTPPPHLSPIGHSRSESLDSTRHQANQRHSRNHHGRTPSSGMASGSSASLHHPYAHEHIDVQPLKSQHRPSSSTISAQNTFATTRPRSSRITGKNNREEQIWPPELEAVFFEAIIVIPKLGRRKVMENGKLCGRNELISAFIKKNAGVERTRKQVSSHIQVLKNARKDDKAFLELLSDEVETTSAPISINRSPSMSTSPMGSPGSSRLHEENSDFEHRLLSGYTAEESTPILGYEGTFGQYPHDTQQLAYRHDPQPSDFSSQHERYLPCQPQQETASPLYSDSNAYEVTEYHDQWSRSHSSSSVYQQGATTPDSAVSLPMEENWKGHLSLESMVDSEQGVLDASLMALSGHGQADSTGVHSDMVAPFWPSVFALFTEYIPETSPTTTDIHTLARSQGLAHQAFGTVNVQQLSSEKFPTLDSLLQKSLCTFLFSKVKLDLNLQLNGNFGNSCLFDARERLTVHCQTTIYSFGGEVLAANEMKQAAFMDGKFVYNFQFVNQFFNAFLSGIRALSTWEEVNIALTNLAVVQVFRDVATQDKNAAPLLVMAYEFERGHGDVDTFFIADGSDMLESIVC